MAARTHAAKLRAKRGRPKVEIVFREPNGRASRAKEPADKLALEARARMIGSSLIVAKNPMAATFIGRLHLNYLAWEKRDPDKPRPVESLSTEEYEAATRYLEIHNDHAKAIESKGAIYDHVGGGAGDTEAHSKWCQGAKARYDAVRLVITTAQGESRFDNLWAALDYIILQDRDFSHMVGSLRILCNAMARHFRAR